MRKTLSLKLIVLMLTFIILFASSAFGSAKAARDEFKQSYRRAEFYQLNKNITRIYGQAFGSGNSPIETAENFRINHSDIWGINPDDLYPQSLLADGSHTQPVMYDKKSDSYKFTLIYYTQYLDNVPVFKADLRLLVRNERGYPLVLAASALKNLGDFRINLGLVGGQSDRAVQSALKVAPGLTEFSNQKTVVWAGYDYDEKPRLAVEFEGSSDYPERWLFVADIETGEILYKENLIIFEDVVGNVSGLATDNYAAEQCDAEVSTAMSYARVNIGSTVAYADSSGNFVIPNGGSSPVTVYSAVRGQWFITHNQAGSDTELNQTVTPPGPANFVHNSGNTEFTRAEVNGYVQSNIVRDFTLKYNPTYPTIYNQYEFPVYVNETTGYCPGNAWYDGYSINFCQASSGYTNTAFSTIVHHEYGHHLVAVAGSGQGQYGEGMGDVMGILITDDPGLAYGFYVDGCNDYMRTGDNTLQYPCSDEIHYCGQLLSGCVWSTRNELVITEPVDYLDIISNLAINAMLLHSGTLITPQITIDYLTLDDDDGNIYNGTPHYDEIDVGFSAHNMPAPELLTGLVVSPTEDFQSEGPGGGPFSPSSKIYTVENLSEYGINYVVTSADSWISITNGSGYLAPSATQQVTIAIGTDANSLPDGRYEGSVSFVNTTDHEGDTSRDVILKVGIPQVIYEWTMDTNPGWTTEGLWAYGQPTGGGGSYGGPDPTGGYTGNNVYGYNLAGDYENYLAETHLTSNAFDCTGLSDVTLKFYRWLGVETPTYDHAYVRVSNNGINWTTVWQNTEEIADYSWVLQEIDISAVADNQPTVYLRWTMGETDVAWQYCGWNLDDIQIEALGGEEPPLYVTLPDGAPEYLEPGTPTSFNVGIADGAESYVSGTGTLYYRYYGGGFLTASLTPSGGNLYEATLPAAGCSANPEFYISAQGDSGSIVTNPVGAPTIVLTATVGVLSVLFEDDFESNMGWTVTGNATDGQWNRGVPVGGGDRGDPPTDYDGSGQCYLTDNVDGNSDVDGGSTYLISPAMDLSIGNVTFNYAVWYTNNAGDDPNNDVFRTWVSNNNGSTWVKADSIGPVSSSGWSERSFLVDDFVTPTSQVKVRFEASDLNAGSIVEAAIDQVSAISFVCDSVAYGTLAGTVTDGSAPVEGVIVHADDGTRYEGTDTTAVDGSYSIDLPVSSYSVNFSHADYHDTTVTGVAVEADLTTTLDMVLTELPPGGVGGAVTDGTNPISGVAVFADDGFGNTGADTTEADGSYSITLPGGSYDISFSHEEYYDTTISNVSIIDHQITTLDVVMTVLPPAYLGGTVTDGSDPVQGVAVYADDGADNTGTDTTDAVGSYMIELAEGTYNVSFTHAAYIDSVVTGIVIIDHQTTTLDIILNPVPPGHVSGTVSDNETNPLEGVLVELISGVTLIASDSTDASGEYLLSDIEPGIYELNFINSGYYDDSVFDIEVITEQTTTVNITLHRPGHYSGIVNDYYGSPVENVHVLATPTAILSSIIEGKSEFGITIGTTNLAESDRELPLSAGWDPVSETYTNGDGEYELILEPGSYTIAFDLENWDSFETGQIDVTLDMILGDQNAILRSPGSLSGTIDYGGSPVESVYIEVIDSDMAVIGDAYSGSDGIYLIENIYDGDYTVMFSHDEYIPVTVADFHINDGPDGTILDQTLQMGGLAYLPGDANMFVGNWPPSVIGSDVTYLVGFFRGSEANQSCLLSGFWCSADANGDCTVIGSDVTRLVNFFRGIGDIQYCPDYDPLWLSVDDVPAEAPSGWPDCEMPLLNIEMENAIQDAFSE